MADPDGTLGELNTLDDGEKGGLPSAIREDCGIAVADDRSAAAENVADDIGERLTLLVDVSEAAADNALATGVMDTSTVPDSDCGALDDGCEGDDADAASDALPPALRDA